MQSKHTTRSTERINIKSNKDFETLIVNPELVNKIEGEVVCIIDDYITNGYSAEAAKHLLLAAGAKEVIFLAFGKFGTKYYSTNYKIKVMYQVIIHMNLKVNYFAKGFMKESKFITMVIILKYHALMN